MRLPWVDLECYRSNDEIFAFQFEDMTLTVPRALYSFPEGSTFFFRARDSGRYPGRPDTTGGFEVRKSSLLTPEGLSGGMYYADQTVWLDIGAEDTRSVTRNTRLNFEMDAVIPGRGRQTLCRGALHVHHLEGLNDPDIASLANAEANAESGT